MILTYISGIELLQILQFKLYPTGSQNYKYSYFCLRFSPDYQTPDVPTSFNWRKEKGFDRAVEPTGLEPVTA